MPKKVYLKNVNFDFEKSEDTPLGAHLSYTTPHVGGAASGLNDPILLKAENAELTHKTVDLLKQTGEVQVTMTMEDFLIKFFHMFSDDAATLAKLLGFESSFDEAIEMDRSFSDVIEERLEGIEILKSLKDGKKEEDLSPEERLDILKIQELFEANAKRVNKSLLDGGSSPTGKNKDVESSTQSNNENVNKAQKGEEMTDKKKDEELTVDEIQKSLQAEIDKLKSENEKRDNVIKAFQEKEDKRLEEMFIAKSKKLSFVKEEEAEGFGKVLKSLDEESALKVLDVLNAAQEEVNKANGDMYEQMSASGETDVTGDIQKSKEGVSKLIEKLKEA